MLMDGTITASVRRYPDGMPRIPCPPPGCTTWTDAWSQALDMSPLTDYQRELVAWMSSGWWWTRLRRRLNPWVKSRIETAESHGALDY